MDKTNKINNLQKNQDSTEAENVLPWLGHNPSSLNSKNIFFLNTEAFAYYWSHFEPEVIKPLKFSSEKADRKVCHELTARKNNSATILDFV